MNEKIKLEIIFDHDVLQQLSLGSILITNTIELAGDWKRRYGMQQINDACEMPQIYTAEIWQNQMIQRLSDNICLNKLQEQLLWQQSIKKDLPDLPDARIVLLANQARRAYRLMQDYRIPSKQLAQANSVEAKALARWIDGVHHALQKITDQPYILQADIADLLLSSDGLLAALHSNISTTLILDGFENCDPMMQACVQVCQQAGVMLLKVERQQKPDRLTLQACENEHEEYCYIAQEIQQILAQQPQARIAILGASIDMFALKRQLQQSLAPASCFDPKPAEKIVTMTGESLLNTPMIEQLSHFLLICKEKEIRFDDFAPLLFCPWLRGFEQERMARAGLDRVLRQQNQHTIKLDKLSQSPLLENTLLFQSILKTILQWQKNMPEQQLASAWVQCYQQLLQDCFFAPIQEEKHRVYSLHEMQEIHALQACIDSLTAIDAIQDGCTWSEFLVCLRTVCAERALSQAAHFPNIQVLSLQQAVGMQFDYTFICGMDNAHFPPPARPASLLPLHMQEAYALPMSHGSLIYDSSSRLWQQLQHTAATIYITYAKQRDGQTMQVSSFMAHLPVQTALSEHTSINQGCKHGVWETESFDDKQTIAVTDPAAIRGGTSIVKHQSACPFRAFAVHRLGIQMLRETSPGIESALKGSLIHSALEYIWQHLLTQERLLAMDSAQREKLIDAAMQHAWKDQQTPIDAKSRIIEEKRMFVLLQQWLELECERSAFQIEALEKTYRLSLPSDHEKALPITIKADRMDKDMQGHRILIDYKTGKKQSSSQWLGERMTEPQLPMYAVAAELGMQDAVSFASIRSGNDMGFEGLTADDLGIKGLTLCDGKRGHPDDWQAVLDHWKKQLDTLALEFIEGCSDVSPRDKNACDFCQLEAVCRIDELTGMASSTSSIMN